MSLKSDSNPCKSNFNSSNFASITKSRTIQKTISPSVNCLIFLSERFITKAMKNGFLLSDIYHRGTKDMFIRSMILLNHLCLVEEAVHKEEIRIAFASRCMQKIWRKVSKFFALSQRVLVKFAFVHDNVNPEIHQSLEHFHLINEGDWF